MKAHDLDQIVGSRLIMILIDHHKGPVVITEDLRGKTSAGVERMIETVIRGISEAVIVKDLVISDVEDLMIIITGQTITGTSMMKDPGGRA